MIGLETETAIDLTTLARVNAWIGSPDADTLIGYLISTVSRDAMLDILKRPTEKKLRSEYFDIRRSGQKSFFVKANPIDTSTAPIVVYNTDTPRAWDDSDDVINADYIICDPDRAAMGEVYVDYTLAKAVNAIKITYTGGMAANAAAMITAYPDVAMKIDMQIAYLWQRKNNLGIRSEGILGANIVWYNGQPWLADVAATLQRYARGL